LAISYTIDREVFQPKENYAMARKRTMNYRELRSDAEEEEVKDDEEGDEDEDEEDDDEEEEGDEEAAEGAEPSEEGEEGDDEDAPPKKKKKVKVKAKPKRTRVAKVVRMRVTWGVFNNSHQMVAQYDYPKREDADAHAAKLIADKKTTHFVQPVKEPIEEKKDETEKPKKKK
jgi:cobalamin biosynthesis protein CobT